MPYRPGITGAATLIFRGEEEILKNVDPEMLDVFYDERIKPLKARIDARYMRRATLWTDLLMLGDTFLACVRRRSQPPLFSRESWLTISMPKESSRKLNMIV